MLADDLEDISYIVIWSVSLDENHMVNRIELDRAMDMSKVRKNEWPIFAELKPSKLFVERAKAQIAKMDWSDYKPDTPDASAHSYLYHSDPDNPVSSNDNSR
jgi:hypothetical protein